MYDRAAVSNRRIDPSNGFGPLAVVTLHLRHKRQQNKSVVQLNMSRQHCQTAILRAVQLGLICKTEVHQAIYVKTQEVLTLKHLS
jgi:hypothetical protein